MAYQVGVVRRRRFQLRFPCLLRAEIAKGEGYYNYEICRIGVEELSGRSVFYKDVNGDVFHTYSSFGRGGEDVLGTYRLLDLVPKGRDETGPNRNLSDWVRHHDRYGDRGFVAPTGRWVPEASES